VVGWKCVKLRDKQDGIEDDGCENKEEQNKL